MKAIALLLGILALPLCGAEIPAGMSAIPAGSYIPMFGETKKSRQVDAFFLDQTPVTNAQFLAFVTSHPEWRRSNVKRLFADEGYLRQWAGDLELGVNAPPDSPVVRVSWFAARAYLKSVGKRLPTEDEWEYAARADATRADASSDPAFLAKILKWYGQPQRGTLPDPTTAEADVHGVRALHGLTWEWVEDFNNQMVTGAARDDASLNRALFCAGGAATARDIANYAAFMRYAFRSSLEGAYTVDLLGFRGAKDPTPKQP